MEWVNLEVGVAGTALIGQGAASAQKQPGIPGASISKSHPTTYSTAVLVSGVQVFSKQWLFRQNSRRARRYRESARDAPCPSGDRAACPMARASSRLRSSSAVRSPGRAPRRHRPVLLSPRQPGQPRLLLRSDSRPVLRNPASAQLAPHPSPGRSEFSPQTTSSTPSRTPPFPKSGSARPL
jgi:hypothetical protein